jgi:hypothetical protein
MSDNVVGYAKPVYDLFDEFHCLGCYNGGGRLYFNLFCEFIHCYKDVCESTFGFPEQTNQI